MLRAARAVSLLVAVTVGASVDVCAEALDGFAVVRGQSMCVFSSLVSDDLGGRGVR
jgi:hypothetical protein